MNDTNKAILSLFQKGKKLSSSQVHKQLAENVSLVTVKRRLSGLLDDGYLQSSGAGRSIKYELSKKGWLNRPIDVKGYLSEQPDVRSGHTSFEFDVFSEPYIDLFTESEITQLDEATNEFRKNAHDKNTALHSKELMRFMVEFSWKTSHIEGNTYDLISTERLLRHGEKSPNNTEYEAQMIINQKDALEFILDNLQKWQEPTIALMEQIQTIVGKNLNIPSNLRKSLVGITGTDYRPLDNEFQIKEALESLLAWINSTPNVYEKTLLGVLGISYIQPFVDGNKRTARLVGDGILMSRNYAPLSYRSVDEQKYKEATLVFYEQNSIIPFKELFIEQYVFAANNYNLALK